MSINRRHFMRLTLAAGAAPVAASLAGAQAYPTRPLRLVIPFPPGGAFDAVGRPLADKMTPHLGTLVIENIGGGGSSIGASAVARAAADGYTILLGGTQTHVNEALLKSKPMYDPVKDLDPIAGVASYALCFAVHASVPVQTLNELVAYAKANPGKLSFGHAGAGSIQHLTGELFKAKTDAPDIIPVAYRGTGPAITDLVSGHIPMGVLAVTGQVIGLHRGGQIRVLAVTARERLSVAPEFPATPELGYPELVVRGSIGLLAPAGTAKPIIEQIAQATRAAVATPDFQNILSEAAIEPMLNSNPEDWRRTLAGDIALWRPLVQALALKID